MSYGHYNTTNPYEEAPAAEAGRGRGNDQYEMRQYGQHAPPPVLSHREFLDRISHLRNEIRGLTGDVHQVAALHQRSLTAPDASVSQSLDYVTSQTQLRNTQIKDGIRELERDLSRTTDGSRAAKATQLNSLKNNFRDELQKFQSSESEYSKRYRDQIARQYRIVNPDATDADVQDATNADWGDEGVFQTALRNNRTLQGQTVLDAVRTRHTELQRVEKTLTELAELFQEMAAVVERDEVAVQSIEAQAESAVEHIQEGNVHVDKGIDHARRKRKLMWWCVLVVVLIILGLALGIGLGIGLANQGTKTATGG